MRQTTLILLGACATGFVGTTIGVAAFLANANLLLLNESILLDSLRAAAWLFLPRILFPALIGGALVAWIAARRGLSAGAVTSVFLAPLCGATTSLLTVRHSIHFSATEAALFVTAGWTIVAACPAIVLWFIGRRGRSVTSSPSP